jgi:hypothetical protein
MYGAQNPPDAYGMLQFEAAARSRKAPLTLIRVQTEKHNVLDGHAHEYLDWLRAVFDDKPLRIANAETVRVA